MKDILITLTIAGAVSIVLIAIGGIGFGGVCALGVLAGAVTAVFGGKSWNG